MSSELYCIAHRGGPGPENSLEAIDRSLALGVDAIEIDLWHLGGKLLVTHDRRLGRQLPGEGRLLDQSLATLDQLRLENGEPIPTLTQVLERVGERALLNIEIKGPDCAAPLANCLRDRGADLTRYLVSSFDQPQLYQLRHRLPEVKRGLLIAGVPLDYARCAQTLDAYSLHCDIDFVSQALVDDAHARGLKAWVYTANHTDDWHALVALGVDGAFTDRPTELLAFNRASANP